MQQQDSSYDDPIYPGDLFRMLLASWRLIGLCLGTAIALAAGYLAATPSQYEATLLVRPAYQVVLLTLPASTAPLVNVVELESLEHTVVRLNDPAFQATVLRSLGWGVDARAQLFRSSIKANQRRIDVEVKLRGFSPGDAQTSAVATLKALSLAQRGLIDSIAAQRTERMRAIDADISEIEASQSRLDKISMYLRASDRREMIERLRISLDLEAQLRYLRGQARDLKEAMNLTWITTYDTVDSIAVPVNLIYPKRNRTWLVAVVGGLLLGLFLATLRLITRQRTVADKTA